jgi:hypothetical protein
MLSYKDIIDKFTLLLLEYIQHINASDVIKTIDNPDLFVFGLNALVHVYKLSVHITKNVDTAVSYSQKGMYCYLEYIEQLHKSNLVNNLDCSDAIAFVYNKTISDIFGAPSNSQSTSISNVLSLDNHDDTTSDVYLKDILSQLEKITTIFLWTNNPDITYTQRSEIVHKWLFKYMTLMVETEQYIEYTNAVLFLSSIQEHLWLTYDEYVDFLDEYLKWMKRLTKYKTPSLTKEHVRSKLLYVLVYYKDRSLDQICGEEGWKKKNELVKWFFTI